MRRCGALLITFSSLLTTPAFALNILLSNDDGYAHANIRALYSELRSQGHNVKIAAPFSEQSARGGAFIYGRKVQIGQDADPAWPDSYYLSTSEKGVCTSLACAGETVDITISATPVMAVLMGLKKVMPQADLVIVGPNPGNNLGVINNASGTFNAASVALLTGVPSLAVSTDLKEKNPLKVATLIAGLVKNLEQHRQPDGALLPKGIGLNINLPPLTAIKGVRLTQVGSYVPFAVIYTDDMGKLDVRLAGQPGISFQYNPPPGASQQDDEAVWLDKGYLTISPFNAIPATVNAASELQSLLSLPLPPLPLSTNKAVQ
ncbi:MULTISPECIES: 5'/3'-nucleotidase SurE [Pseudomonas syringae group]|uniref:5'/3'-nucleotidase SurE n=1 Tax=Pseudomonas syringae group TaxID=136849 RepID=UPI000BB65DD8|nr:MULTISPECIES: 5'/3'-nucleotidase SurE [Pseudomonas syringae group]MDU8357514.1 5'/3'-nucleotidase SurE [Pseudomonas syringae group sp. J309-1]PBQ10126.1 stationary-phase survival protein [Pseudomonas syringae]